MTHDAKQGIAGIFDRTAATYDTVIPFFSTFGRQLVETAGLRAGERVLDLACGRGACLRFAAAAVGERGTVVGVDLSEAMIQSTAADWRGVNNVSLHVGDAEKLDFETASFDTVVCGFGVFFFPDPPRALAECRRVLRCGGRFAASTFATGSGGYPWTADVARQMGTELPLAASRVRQAAGLRAVLQDAGFTEIETARTEGRFVFPDVDSYVAWNWSHAGRRLLESLDVPRLQDYRAQVAGRLARHAIEGGFELVQEVDNTVARRP